MELAAATAAAASLCESRLYGSVSSIVYSTSVMIFLVFKLSYVSAIYL